MSRESVDNSIPISVDAVDSIIAESEQVTVAVSCPEGLTRVDGDDHRHVEVSIVVLATNEQLYFVSAAGGESGRAAGSLGYDRLRGVETEAGGISLATVDGVVWRLPRPDEADSAVSDLLSHLRWVGQVRSEVLATANDVDLAAGEIGDAAAEMDWDRGEERYEAQRDALDRLVDTIHRTEPVDSGALAPELTDLERTLEGAYAGLLIDRAESRLGLGQQLVRTGDHERALDVIASARGDHDQARRHAEAVKRTDAFMFGEQRELTERLDRLGWEIQAVAAEPLRRAHEAKILAREATDPEETADHWEAAFRRYSGVSTLQRGENGEEIAGDVAEIRQEVANAAGQLIAIHRALARTKWDDGLETAERDVAAGVEEIQAAIEHLDCAHDLAEEFRPDAAPDMRERVEKMRDGVDRLREAPTYTPGAGAAGDPQAATATTPGSASEAGATNDPVTSHTGAEGLADMDTHHEVQTEGAVGDTDRAETDAADPDLDERGSFALQDSAESE